MIEAASLGLDDKLRRLLERGMDPNAASPKGLTALFLAAQNEHLGCVQILLDAGANPSLVCLIKDRSLQKPRGKSVLGEAAFNGNIRLLKLLLEAGADPNPDIPHGGKSPLSYAASECNVEAAELLLAHGASVTRLSHTGLDCLSIVGAGWKPSRLSSQKVAPSQLKEAHASLYQMVKLLLEAGADPKYVPPRMLPKLYWAAWYNVVDVLTLLIQAGVDVNLQEQRYGETALLAAVQKKQYDTVTLLLNAGADVNLAGFDTTTPLYHAVVSKDEQLVQMLLEAGADTSMQFMFGNWGVSRMVGIPREPMRGTAIHLAAIDAHCGIVELLLQYGADATERVEGGAWEKDGWDALSMILFDTTLVETWEGGPESGDTGESEKAERLHEIETAALLLISHGAPTRGRIQGLAREHGFQACLAKVEASGYLQRACKNAAGFLGTESALQLENAERF
eukprot:gene11172-13202_t